MRTPSLANAAAFGKNLGNVALGHGAIDNISAAIKSGNWAQAAACIGMAGLNAVSNVAVVTGVGAIGKAAVTVGLRGGVTKAATATTRAFWSGGTEAMKEAMKYGKVIDQSLRGKATNSALKGLGKVMGDDNAYKVLRPAIKAVSWTWARGAQGPVSVVIKTSRYRGTQSIWYQTEQRQLQRQGTQVIYRLRK